MKPSSLIIAAVAAAAAATFAGSPSGHAAAAATPPPSPPPITGPAVTPAPAATMLPTPGPAGTSLPTPSATLPVASTRPSPPPESRKGLNGVWEIQIQHPSETDYTHINVVQDGDQLSGTYLDSKNKKYPLVGTVDGQDVRMIVTLPNGTTLLMEGKLDGTTDMIGMLTTTGGQVPFTAAYRAKEKWIENVNPSPGGMGQSGGGGYTPP